jgi:small subunit ribosomal protein S6
MAEYELMVALDVPDEAENKKALETIKQIVDKLKGAVVKEDIWGEKQMAFPLRKRDSAWYTVFTLELNKESAKRLVKSVLLEKFVMRSLLTKPVHQGKSE